MAMIAEILNPADMKPKGILHPSKLAVDLSLKAVSTARAEMPLDQVVDFGTWIKVYYPNGRFGIFRASIPEKDFDTGKATVTFDHGVKTLADNVVNVGDTYDSDGVSQPTYFEGTVSTVFKKMLGYQRTKFWQFGKTDTNEKIKVEVDYDNLYSLMNDTMSQLPEYYLDYDQTSFPWTVNIKKYPTTVKAEGRLSRNIKTAKIRYDDGELVTRVYCEALGTKSGYIESANVKKYGIREAHNYLGDVDKDFAKKSCQQYLASRDEPKISVTIEGADFSALTGVALDKIILGDLYRLVIPERSVKVEQQITGIGYTDLVNAPYELTVSLASDREDLSSAMAGVRKTANKNSRASKKSGTQVVHVYEKLKKEAEVTTDHGKVLRSAGIEYDENGVLIFAKEIGLDTGSCTIVASKAGGTVPMYETDKGKTVIANIPDGTVCPIVKRGKTWTSVIYQNKTGWVKTANIKLGEKQTLGAAFNVTAEKLTSDYTNQIMGAESHIEQTAEELKAEVKRSVNADKEMAGKLDIQSDQVSLVVGIKDNRKIKIYPQRVADEKNGIKGFPTTGKTNLIYYAADEKRYYEWKDGKYSLINGDGVTPHINAGGIVSEINKDETVTTRIKGDKVYIGDTKSTTIINGKLDADKVTASYLVGKMLNATGVTLNGITVNGSAAFNGSLLVANGSDEYGTTYASVKNAIYDLNIVKSGNNTYKLQRKRFPDADWVDVGSFSRAISTLTASWTDGRCSVTAQPQDDTRQVCGIVNGGSWSGNTYNGKIQYYEGSDDDGVKRDTGLTYKVSRAISTLTASWTSGRCSVTAQPQNDTRQVCGIVTSGSWSGNTYNGKVQYYEGSDDDGTKRDTGLTFTVDATSIYNSVTVSSVARSGSTVTATASNGKTKTLTLTSHTYCHQGLNYYDNSDAEITSGKTKLYYKKSGSYFTAGTHYWFSADDNKTLHTYYD